MYDNYPPGVPSWQFDNDDIEDNDIEDSVDEYDNVIENDVLPEKDEDKK